MSVALNRTMMAGLSVLAAVAFVFGTGSARAAEFTLTCAHDQPVAAGSEGYREIMWQHFKKNVEAKSNGRIEVKLFGNSQLGDEPTIVQNMLIGTVDCGSLSAANAQTVSELQILAVPYVVENLKHRACLVDVKGPLTMEVTRLAKERLNVHVFGTEHSSVRSIYTKNKPINTPDDLKGLKVRTMPSKGQVEGWKALGAIPSAIAFSEVYAALQSGAVDGAENSPMFFWGMKHYEQVKYYSLTGHLMNIGWEIIHDRALQKLPADLRPMVLQAGLEASLVGQKYDIDVDEKFLNQLKGAGIVINTVDTKPFVARAAAVHDSLAKELKGEKVLEIVRAEGKRCS